MSCSFRVNINLERLEVLLHRGEQCDICPVLRKLLCLAQPANNSLNYVASLSMSGLRSFLGHSEEMWRPMLSAPHLGCEKQGVSISSLWIPHSLTLTCLPSPQYTTDIKIKSDIPKQWTKQDQAQIFLECIKTFRKR